MDRAVAARDACQAVVGEPVPRLDRAVEEAKAELAQLQQAKQASKPPVVLLREAEREHARVSKSRDGHVAALAKAETALTKAQADVEAERQWVATREREVAAADVRVQMARAAMAAALVGPTAVPTRTVAEGVQVGAEETLRRTAACLQALPPELALAMGMGGEIQAVLGKMERALQPLAPPTPVAHPAAPVTPAGEPQAQGPNGDTAPAPDDEDTGEATAGASVAPEVQYFPLSDEDMEEVDEEAEVLVQAAADTNSAAFRRVKELLASSKRRPVRTAMDAKRGVGADPPSEGAGGSVRKTRTKSRER